jgi:hypothetical protein
MATTTVSRIPLSGSTHGRGIKIAATASAGDTVHTATSSTTDCDVITLYAYNSSGSSVNLTVQWGGTTSVDDDIKLAIPATSGLTLILPDLVLRNSLIVKAYAGTTNVVTIHGFANRVTTA